MVRHARALGLARALALGAALSAAPAPLAAVEVEGDLYLTLANDDAQRDRWHGEAAWIEPLADWVKGEIGAHYSSFDDARWGYGILGAHLALPGGRDRLSTRYEHGAGDGEAGDYRHVVAKLGWTHAFVADRIFANAGFQWIRVDRVRENLVQVGVGLVPLSRLKLQVDYHHSVLGGEGTRAWSARGDVYLRRAALFAGFARSEDTVDLRSIGGSRNQGRPTSEVFAGVQLPVGRHGVTLAASRHRSRFDTRYGVSLTLRWNLFYRSAPDADADEPDPAPLGGGGRRAYALRQGSGGR